MGATDVAIKELERAGLFRKDSDYSGMIGDAVKELLLVFQKQGHSGYSAQIAAELFHRLIKGEPISPLTDSPEEWHEVTDGLFQSMRCSYVFRDKKIQDKKPYTIQGKVFSDDGGKSYWQNHESRVHFDLPGYPPDTQYVIKENKP